MEVLTKEDKKSIEHLCEQKESNTGRRNHSSSQMWGEHINSCSRLMNRKIRDKGIVKRDQEYNILVDLMIVFTF